MRQERLVNASVGIVSSTTILFELLQTRILSFIFWQHLVYLTVSIALLGFGISGTIVAIHTPKNTPRTMLKLWTWYGASILLAVVSSAWLLPYLRWAPSWEKLAFCYIIFTLPFIFAGAILSIIFSSSPQKLSVLYSVDLLSAGACCLLFIFLLPALGAATLACLLSFLAFAVAAFLARKEKKALRVFHRTAPLVVALFTLWTMIRPSFLDFSPENYKELSEMLSTGDVGAAKVEYVSWTALGRVDVVGNPKANLLGYKEHPLGSYKIITQDGSAHTRLPSFAAIRDQADRIESGTEGHGSNIPYVLTSKPDVAVIGVGGGIDVASALAHGANSIVGIELNPSIFSLVTSAYSAYQGHIFSDPRVTLINGEGRSVIRSLDRKFDLIQVVAIDTFAALSSGAYVLSENYLYTVEAFTELLAHLKDGGVICFYRWLFTPPRETLRLCAVACEAWRRQGLDDPGSRIAIIKDGHWAASLFRKRAFSGTEQEAIIGFVRRFAKQIVFLPGMDRGEGPQSFPAYRQLVADDRVRGPFQRCIEAFRQGTEQHFFRSYMYQVSPTEDDKPFFFEYDFRNRIGMPKIASLRASGVGTTLYIILIESTIFIFLATFLPLWHYARRGIKVRGAGAAAVYFAALGLGFMIMEIGLMQKSTIFLGSPIYSISVILASLLLSAGLGSRVFGRAQCGLKKITRWLGLAFVGLSLLAIIVISKAFFALLALPIVIKLIIVVAITFPLGILMGAFFPEGLEHTKRKAPAFVPWAWGINGCASVYGSIIAIIAAMNIGFRATLLLGIGVYAIGFIAAQMIPDGDEAGD